MKPANLWIDFKSFLTYARITDETGVMSLTNVMLLIVLFKVATAPQAGLGEISTLLLGLVSYNGKKWFGHVTRKKKIDDQDRLAKLEAEQKSLVQIVNLKNIGR